MNGMVCYLIADPSTPDQLIFPAELKDKHYRGHGSFYILQPDDRRLKERYVLYAFVLGRIVPLVIERGNRNLPRYSTNIGVGEVEYHFSETDDELRYQGSSVKIRGWHIVGRLTPLSRILTRRLATFNLLDIVGYSPLLEDDLPPDSGREPFNPVGATGATVASASVDFGPFRSRFHDIEFERAFYTFINRAYGQYLKE